MYIQYTIQYTYSELLATQIKFELKKKKINQLLFFEHLADQEASTR